jgi:hypothetical protein
MLSTDWLLERRDYSQTPGFWAGCIIHTDNDCVEVSISLERWDKAKGMLHWIATRMKSITKLWKVIEDI